MVNWIQDLAVIVIGTKNVRRLKCVTAMTYTLPRCIYCCIQLTVCWRKVLYAFQKRHSDSWVAGTPLPHKRTRVTAASAPTVESAAEPQTVEEDDRVENIIEVNVLYLHFNVKKIWINAIIEPCSCIFSCTTKFVHQLQQANNLSSSAPELPEEGGLTYH